MQRFIEGRNAEETKEQMVAELVMQHQNEQSAETAAQRAPGIKKKKKKEIGFRMDIREITYIKTACQSYGIKGALKLSWLASKEDVQSFQESAQSGGAYRPSFVPHIEWTNDIECEDYKLGAIAVKKDKKTGTEYNTQSISFNMSFTEEFEVEHFPFDVQDLSMVFHDRGHNEFVPHHTMDNFLKLDKAWSSITDWELDRIEASKAAIPYQSGRKGSYQKVTVKIQVKRKWEGLVYRLVAWLCILGIMSWSTFAVHPSEVGDRLSNVVTMALTIVAFQFIISSQLPQVNYMTMMDRYNLFIFGFVLMVTAESTLVGYHGDGIFEDSEQIDRFCAAATAFLFVAGNIGFAVFAKYARKIELDKLGKWQPYRINALYVSNDSFFENNARDYSSAP